MSVGARLKAAFRALFDTHREQFLTGQEPFGGVQALAGVDVNGQSAMKFSAFFSGVQQISQTVASLPLPVYRMDGEIRNRDRTHPLYGLLNRMANPWMTALVWRETMQHHMLVWGNGYSYIMRDRVGRPVGLMLMNPERTWPEELDGRIVYKHRGLTGQEMTIERSEIFHIPGIGFDGIKGYSLLTVARESIGIGLAMQEFTGRFYGTGTHVGGVVERPVEAPRLEPNTAKQLMKDLALQHQGLGKSHSLMLLEEGMKYTPVGMPLKDAEFLGSRQFSIQDIARFLNMPPHKLKELSRATFSNIEHEQLSYVMDTIRPWLTRWESHINTSLISPRYQAEVFAEHIMEGLLRADTKSRNEALAIQRQNGVINPNEWRKLDNRNPIPGPAGEAYLVNGNMISAETAADQSRQPVGGTGV